MRSRSMNGSRAAKNSLNAFSKRLRATSPKLVHALCVLCYGASKLLTSNVSGTFLTCVSPFQHRDDAWVSTRDPAQKHRRHPHHCSQDQQHDATLNASCAVRYANAHATQRAVPEVNPGFGDVYSSGPPLRITECCVDHS